MEGKPMGNFHQDFKRMVDDVPVPTKKLDQLANTTLEEVRRKKNRTFHNRQRLFASVASVMVIIISSLLFSTYLLGQASISTEDSILFTKGDAGLKRMVEEERVKELFLVSEDQGVKVTLVEAFLDNNQLAFSYSVQLKEEHRELMTEDQSNISMKVISDGKTIVEDSTSSRVNAKLEYSEIFTLRDANIKRIHDSSEMEIHIGEINGVKGEWSFKFPLEKEREYIERKQDAPFVDKLGNSFFLSGIQLTPSMLQFNMKRELIVENEQNSLSTLEIAVITEKEGEFFIERLLRRSSESRNAYHPQELDLSMVEKIEIARGTDSYQYQIIPFISNYKREIVEDNRPDEKFIFEEIRVPFLEGEILTAPSPIEVVEIKNSVDFTIVYYAMDTSVPRFPTIINRENDSWNYPISFKLHGDFVEVKYPKVKENESLELFVYDTDYQTFPGLDIRLDFK